MAHTIQNRHDQRDEYRQDATDRGAQGEQVEAGDRRQGDDGRAEGPVGDRRGVADQRQPGGVDRPEAQAQQHRARDRDRRAETGGALDERSEAEGDEGGSAANPMRSSPLTLGPLHR